MATENTGQNVPEKTRYTRYYEHDGMLRAYANRSMVREFPASVCSGGGSD